ASTSCCSFHPISCRKQRQLPPEHSPESEMDCRITAASRKTNYFGKLSLKLTQPDGPACVRPPTLFQLRTRTDSSVSRAQPGQPKATLSSTRAPKRSEERATARPPSAR